MKIKRSIMVLVTVLVIAMVLGACGAGNTPAASPGAPAASAAQSTEAAATGWSVAVEGASQSVFTSEDYAKLTPVKIDTVLKKKDGSETKQVWEGVLLKDVVAALGVTEYKSVTFTAADDYAKDYTPEIVNDAKSILGTVLDGKKLMADDGFVQAVAGSQSGNMWIKSLKSIKVNN